MTFTDSFKQALVLGKICPKQSELVIKISLDSDLLGYAIEEFTVKI